MIKLLVIPKVFQGVENIDSIRQFDLMYIFLIFIIIITLAVLFKHTRLWSLN